MPTFRTAPKPVARIPRHAKEIMGVFLKHPKKRFLKTMIVAALRPNDVPVNSNNVREPLEWLFDHGYILEDRGPGRYQKYFLNPDHRKWPPTKART